MTENNKSILESEILTLLQRPIYNCLKITSKGNVLYVLKDNEKRFYILLIPNYPLDDAFSFQLKSLGYNEKFAKINFSKFIDYDNAENLSIIISEIDFIFSNVFQIESSRHWRFEIDPGMRLLKDLAPLITNSEIRLRKKKKKFKWFNRWKLDLLVSLFAGCSTGIVIIHDKVFKGINYFIIIASCCLLSLILFRLLTFSQRNNLKYGKKWLSSDRRLDFFYSHGFERMGHRFTSKIKGFKTDIYFNGKGEIEIAILHNEISWEKVIKLSNLTKTFSRYPRITWRQNISKKCIASRSNDKILAETIKFIDKIIEFEITPKPL